MDNFLFNPKKKGYHWFWLFAWVSLTITSFCSGYFIFKDYYSNHAQEGIQAIFDQLQESEKYGSLLDEKLSNLGQNPVASLIEEYNINTDPNRAREYEYINLKVDAIGKYGTKIKIT